MRALVAICWEATYHNLLESLMMLRRTLTILSLIGLLLQ